MFIFIILNLIVALTALILVRKFFSELKLADRICIFSLIFLAQVNFSAIFLGISRLLSIGNLVSLNLVILLGAWFLCLKKKTLKKPKFPANDFSWLIRNKTVLACLSLILGFVLVKSIFNLINPSFGWDSLNYHFTFPIEWLKSGSLINPPTICDDPTPTYYPIGGSLIYFWLIAPFRNLFIADLGQLPFFLLAFITSYSIARKFFLSKELSFYAAGLFVIIPNFIKQLEVGYADIIMTALFLTTVNLLFILNKKFDLRYLVLSGLSLGLFLGTKTLSFAYSLAPVLFFIYILFKNRSRPKLFFGYGFLFLSLTVLFGGYGYIRNFLVTGNPLFPLDFTVLGKVIFEGVMPTSTYLVRWTAAGYNLMKLFFHEGMGIQLFLLIFPAAFIALPIALIRKKKLSVALVYFLILPLLIYLIFRYIIPQRWTRFLYPFLAIGSPVAIYVLSMLKVPLKVIRTIVVVCFLACCAEAASHAELGLSFGTAFLSFFLIPVFYRFSRGRKKIMVMVSLLFIALSGGFVFGQKWYLEHEYQRYVDHAPYWPGAMAAWKWLNENTKGEKIAYTGRPVPVPMYGTGFKNDVYYASVNKIHPAQLHYYSQGNLNWRNYEYDEIDRVLRRDENYRGQADYKTWYSNLQKEGTDYLFVYILREEEYAPIEDSWAKRYYRNFELVFDSPDARIYKLTK